MDLVVGSCWVFTPLELLKLPLKMGVWAEQKYFCPRSQKKKKSSYNLTSPSVSADRRKMWNVERRAFGDTLHNFKTPPFLHKIIFVDNKPKDKTLRILRTMSAQTNHTLDNNATAAGGAAFPPLEEYNNKKSFLTALEGLFERIEILAGDDRINTEEYRQFAELVKDMYGFKASIQANPTFVVQVIERYTRETRRAAPEPPSTDQQKLNNPKDNCVCPRCDKPVSKAYYASGDHTATKTCIRQFQTKLNVKLQGKMEHSHYTQLQCLNLCFVPRVEDKYEESDRLKRVLTFSPAQRKLNLRLSANPTPEQTAIAVKNTPELRWFKEDGKWVVKDADFVAPPPPTAEELEAQEKERQRLRRNELVRQCKARKRQQLQQLQEHTTQLAMGGGALSSEVQTQLEIAEARRLRKNELSRLSKLRIKAQKEQLAQASAMGNEPTLEDIFGDDLEYNEDTNDTAEIIASLIDSDDEDN
jgi:hypothetical protein